MINNKILLVIVTLLICITAYVSISANHASNEEALKAKQDAFHKHLVDTTTNEDPSTADAY